MNSSSDLRASRISEDDPDFYVVHQEIGYPRVADRSIPEVTNNIEPHNGLSGIFLGIDRNGWLCLGIGLVLAIIILAFPLFTQLLVVLPILIHEFGHAVFGWLFGYPSLPALDFKYGGGVTIHLDRHILILIGVFILWAGTFYFWAMRQIRRTAVFTAAFILYIVFTFTDTHNIIILFMGHGMELIFAAIFIYRALSGSSVIHPVERPLYGIVGMFMVMNNFRFSYNLLTDETSRYMYEAAKGGGHIMDFSRIAEDYLNTGLTTVAGFFLCCCIITPFVSIAFIKWKDTLSSLLK